MANERNTRVRASQIRSILPNDIEATNSPVDNYVPQYNESEAKFTWASMSGGEGRYETTFDNGDLSSGILSVTHNLGNKIVKVVVANNSDEEVIPTDITFTDTNSLSVDLSSYGTITGTWTVVVISG